ncbi:MAG: PrsW family intramembrane metalloprotease [Chloroflexota bacterium]|nr:PrsW family intramembrane metalloprotease [Chloroflexota bacterium]
MAILIGILISLIVGLLPMVVYALILWWFDRYEKEPLGLLITAFLWGAIPAVIFSLIAELALDIPISYLVEPVTANLVGATVIAPIAEEIFKGVALLLLLIFFRKEIDSPLDGIIYGGLVGFGFAAVENVFYFVSTFLESGLYSLALLAVFRAFLFGLNHAMFTGLAGLGLALARTSPNILVKVGAPSAGLLSGMMAHTIHNSSVMLGAELYWPCLFTFVSDWGGVLILLVIVVWASVQEQRWIATFLADEVEQGTLSQGDYAVVCSYARRVAVRANALFGGDFGRWWGLGHYYRLATELAFSKYRLTRFAGEKDTRARVAQLRRQVREMANDQRQITQA